MYISDFEDLHHTKLGCNVCDNVYFELLLLIILKWGMKDFLEKCSIHQIKTNFASHAKLSIFLQLEITVLHLIAIDLGFNVTFIWWIKIFIYKTWSISTPCSYRNVQNYTLPSSQWRLMNVIFSVFCCISHAVWLMSMFIQHSKV